MPYTVNFTDDNKEPITVQDVSLDESTSIKLVGRDYKGYGEFIAENFLHILENFASPLPPENPIEGQVWYDRSSNQLKVFSTNNAWRTISGNFAGFSEPTGPDRVIGDIWYNSANRNLYVYNGEGWVFFASAVIPATGSEEGIPYVTLNTEQVITAFKEFADEIATNKLTISNDNSGTVLLDLIDTSTPGTNKVMMRLTGNGNPLLVMNSDDAGDYEFRTGDTSIRINDGAVGVENLIRINGAWTTVLGVNSQGIFGTSIATESESRTKTSNTKIMTPARVYHAVDHFVANTVANGGIQATQAEAETGTANDVVMTPLRTKQAFEVFSNSIPTTQFSAIYPTSSGTSVDVLFPVTAREITMYFIGVTCMSDYPLVQMLSSGTPVVTGYVSSSGTSGSEISSTSGFVIYNDSVQRYYHGTMTLTRVSSSPNIWVSSHSMTCGVADANGGGSLTTSNSATGVRLTLANPSIYAFTGGSIVVSWR